MFKALCVVLLFAIAANAYVFSGSTNTGMNAMSSGSAVIQNDIQNAQSVGYGHPYGYGYGYPYYGYGYGRYPYLW